MIWAFLSTVRIDSFVLWGGELFFRKPVWRLLFSAIIRSGIGDNGGGGWYI